MRSNCFISISAGLALACGAERALAQAFNIDFQPAGQTTPSPSFGGAAGQAGQWIGASFPNNQPLTTVDGAASLATIRLFTQGVENWGDIPTANTGDYATLLDDGIMATSTACIESTFVTVQLSGVSNGTYDVYTYAAWPVAAWGSADVYVSGSPDTRHISGTMPGDAFVEGVTHVVHRVTITSGNINIYLYGTDAPFETFLAGIQVVPVNLTGCEVTQHPAHRTVLKEQTAVFSAVMGGDVRSYQWLKDGVPLVNGRGISGATTPTLTLTEARPSDDGVYTLRYRCGSENAQTTGAVLSVIDCAGDVDGDGDVDLSDLSQLLGRFGVICL